MTDQQITSVSTSERVLLLLTLVPYLKEHGATLIPDLAARFNMPEAVIRKLARFLGTAGIPGETLTYQHEDLFDIDWVALEEHDVLDLVKIVAVDDTPRFSATEVASMLAGLHTLMSVLPEEQAAIARSAASKLAEAVGNGNTELSIEEARDRTDDTVSSIAEAIADDRQIAFTYWDRSGAKSERVADPLSLVQSTGEWYLHAFCHTRDAPRVFRVDNMGELSLRSEHRTAKMAHDDTFGEPLGGSHTIVDSVEATIRLFPEMLYRIADWQPAVVGSTNDGRIEATVPLEHPTRAIELVTRVPGSIEIVGPASLREVVHAWARQQLAAGAVEAAD